MKREHCGKTFTFFESVHVRDRKLKLTDKQGKLLLDIHRRISPIVFFFFLFNLIHQCKITTLSKNFSSERFIEESHVNLSTLNSIPTRN